MKWLLTLPVCLSAFGVGFTFYLQAQDPTAAVHRPQQAAPIVPRWTTVVTQSQLPTRLLEHLSSGLPTELQLSATVHSGPRRVASLDRRCRVTFDIWDSVYLVQIGNDPLRIHDPDIRSVLNFCLSLTNEPIGREEDFRALRGRLVRMQATLVVQLHRADAKVARRLWNVHEPPGGTIVGDDFRRSQALSEREAPSVPQPGIPVLLAELSAIVH